MRRLLLLRPPLGPLATVWHLPLPPVKGQLPWWPGDGAEDQLGLGSLPGLILTSYMSLLRLHLNTFFVALTFVGNRVTRKIINIVQKHTDPSEASERAHWSPCNQGRRLLLALADRPPCGH